MVNKIVLQSHAHPVQYLPAVYFTHIPVMLVSADNGQSEGTGPSRINITVTNASPLLLYTPQLLWSEASSNDPLLSNYTTKSYHASNGTLGNARVSYTWSGTGIWVHGAYRQRLGAYSAVLDGESVSTYPGFQQGEAEQTDYLLFSQGNLKNTQHSIELINTSDDQDQSILDIDYIVFESEFSGQYLSSVLNSSSENLTYADSSSWMNNTTDSPDGNLTLSFAGEAVAIYGDVGSTQSPYTVSLDAGYPQQYFPNTLLNSTNQLLFFANGLPQQTHTIVVYNNPSQLLVNRSALNINYAVVYSNAYNDAKTSNRRANIISGLTAGLGFLGLLFVYLFLRWHRKRERRKEEELSYYSPRPFFTPSLQEPRSIRPLPTPPIGVIEITPAHSLNAMHGSDASLASSEDEKHTDLHPPSLLIRTERRHGRSRSRPMKAVNVQMLPLPEVLPPAYHIVRPKV